MRKLVFWAICCLVSTFTALSGTPDLARKWNQFKLEKSTPNPFKGIFNAENLVYYIVHYGGDLKLNIAFSRWKNTPAVINGITLPASLFFQIYDAEERPVKSVYWKFPKGLRKKSFIHSFKNVSAGIYQIRTTSSAGGRILGSLSTKPETSFGVMAGRSMIKAGSRNLTNAYIYVPPQAKKLKIYNRRTETTISEINGKQIFTVKSNQKGEIALSPMHVYKLHFNKKGSVGFSGFPIILCPDKTTARNIRASVEFAPDGSMLHHKFQLRMWKWMHSLKKSQLEVKIVPLEPMKEKFLKKPESIYLLGARGAFSHAGYILKNQDINPKSPSYGDNRDLSYLSLFYSLNEPFNPYYGNKNVMNRYLLNQFRELLKLKENDTFRPGWDKYSGGDALKTLHDYISFALAYKKLPEKLQKLWFNGISRLINRFCLSRVSCENQTAHWLVDSYCMYLATGDDIYKRIAADFAAVMSDPAMNKFIKTGYLQEHNGPDATYQGLCASNLAFYYRMSKDENIKKTLNKIYTLFNHTVAPEPDGTMLGASNFSHRTSGSWVKRQWQGGVPLMAGELKSAGCWIPEDSQKKINLPEMSYDDKWYENNSRWAFNYALSPWLPMWNKYFYPVKKIKHDKLPVIRDTEFTRKFSNEFYCFRRPEYYALVYAGNTSYTKGRYFINQNPLLKGWNLGNNALSPVTATGKKTGWCPTQGLSMFWTPEYGNCILARNWNVYTTQVVRADIANGKVSWSDYRSSKNSYDKANNEVTISTELLNLPVTVIRKIKAERNSVNVNLKVRFHDNADISKLVEQIPLIKKRYTKILFKSEGKWQSTSGKCNAVRIINSKGKGVQITFSAPVSVGLGISTKHFNMELGLLEFYLVSKYKKGTVIVLNYKISVVK